MLIWRRPPLLSGLFEDTDSDLDLDWRPDLDVFELADEFLLSVSLPGVHARDVEIIVVVFPGLVAPLLVDRPMGIAAVESAASQNLHLVLFRSAEPDAFDAAAQLGVAARILRLVRLPAGHVQILLQGAARVRRLSLVEREPVPR